MLFQEFHKIPRLSHGIVITEKIDGTNAQVFIVDKDVTHIDISGDDFKGSESLLIAEKDNFLMFAGSRNKWITPQDDNYGFAGWCQRNADALFTLGEGHHFGEWWGLGIQRRYNQTEKKFSLFNTGRWISPNKETGLVPILPSCVGLVPVLYTGPFDQGQITATLDYLESMGSVAAPGFKPAEGIVIYHAAARMYFKKTILNDEKAKSQE